MNFPGANGSVENNTDPYFKDPPVDDGIFLFACVYYGVIGVFGTVANIGVIVLFVKAPIIRTPFNYILMNLVFAETILSVIGIPSDFLASLYHGWKFGRIACFSIGFILSQSALVSLCTLAFLSLIRWLMIKHPDGEYHLKSYRTTALIIAMLWLYTATMTVPPWLGWGNYAPESSGTSCSPHWESKEHFYYILWMFVLGFFLPLGIIVISSILTIRDLLRASSTIVTNSIKRRSMKRDRRIAWLVLSMNCGFLFCWLPYSVIALVYFFGGPSLIPPALTAFPVMMAKSSVCINPVLYIGMNPQFRGAFRRFVLGRDLNSPINNRNGLELAETPRTDTRRLITASPGVQRGTQLRKSSTCFINRENPNLLQRDTQNYYL